MDFVLSDEHQLLRASVKQMLAKYEGRKREFREQTYKEH
jgi:hypothetical protein